MPQSEGNFSEHALALVGWVKTQRCHAHIRAFSNMDRQTLHRDVGF
jgi:hypothetical protein